MRNIASIYRYREKINSELANISQVNIIRYLNIDGVDGKIQSKRNNAMRTIVDLASWIHKRCICSSATAQRTLRNERNFDSYHVET